MRRRLPSFARLFASVIASLPLALAFAAPALLCACGHKATEADCQFILDRNVEVQMKSMHVMDPVAIDKRKQEIQAELKGALQGCVGKRITDGMLACVARAQTANDIDACMR